MIMTKERKLRVLYSSDQIKEMVKLLAHRINQDFKSYNSKSIVVISVLKGAFMFTADLIREINLSVQLEFIKISSYGSQQHSSGKIEAPILLLPDLNNKDVLIIEDIVDSGRTIAFLKEYIDDQFKPRILKVACLLNKEVRREVNIKADYVGFNVEDYFLVGYGLDSAEEYRHLPYLAVCC